MDNKMKHMGRTDGHTSIADATEFWARNERELRQERAANARIRAQLVARYGAKTADAILAAKAKVERWER